MVTHYAEELPDVITHNLFLKKEQVACSSSQKATKCKQNTFFHVTLSHLSTKISIFADIKKKDRVY